jgi:hypothetical protein
VLHGAADAFAIAIRRRKDKHDLIHLKPSCAAISRPDELDPRLALVDMVDDQIRLVVEEPLHGPGIASKWR